MTCSYFLQGMRQFGIRTTCKARLLMNQSRSLEIKPVLVAIVTGSGVQSPWREYMRVRRQPLSQVVEPSISAGFSSDWFAAPWLRQLQS